MFKRRKTEPSKSDVQTLVKVRMGRHVVDFGDGNRLKCDILLATKLPYEMVDKIVANVKSKLAIQRQPVGPHDIATTAHVTMVEIGYREEAEKYINFITQRLESKWVPKEKIKFIKCHYCSTSNDAEYKYCVGCGRPLDKSDTESKLV
jgi:hypothetical protein